MSCVGICLVALLNVEYVMVRVNSWTNCSNTGSRKVVSSPDPTLSTRRNGLVNQVEFLGLVHAFVTL